MSTSSYPAPISNAKHTSLARRLSPYLAVLFFVILFYAPIFIPYAQFMMGDFRLFHIPNRVYADRALQSGRLPEWTPHIYGGFPFLSDPQAAVFYPINLISTILPGGFTDLAFVKMFVLLQIAILACGSVFLARCCGIHPLGAVVTALIITFNGYSIYHLGHINIIETVGVGLWALGFLILAIKTLNFKYAAAAILFFASAILCGHSQTALYLFYCAAIGAFTFAFYFWRGTERSHVKKTMWVSAVIFIGAFAGSMIQILPTVTILENSERSELSYIRSVVTYARLQEAPALLFPNLYQPIIWRTSPDYRNRPEGDLNWGSFGFWENRFYIGLIAFLLGFWGWLIYWRNPMTHLLFLGSIFMWLAAMGPDMGIYRYFYHFLPGFKQIRIPPRIVIFAFIGWGLLAGLCVHAIATARKQNLWKGKIWIGLVLLLAIGLGAIAALFLKRLQNGSWHHAFYNLFVYNTDVLIGQKGLPPGFDGHVTHQLIYAGIIFALCVLWFVLCRFSSRRLTLAVVAIILLFADLFVYGVHKNIVVDKAIEYDVVADYYKVLPKNPKGRILTYGMYPGLNSALILGIDSVGAYNPLVPELVLRFLPLHVSPFSIQEYHLNLWNIRYKIYPKENIPLILDDRPLNLPRFKWVRVSRNFPSTNKRLDWEIKKNEPPKRIYLVATGVAVREFSDGMEIARLSIHGHKGAPIASHTIRLGREIAEWSYTKPDHPVPPKHSKPPVHFVEPLDANYDPNGLFYISPVDINTTLPIHSIRLQALIEHPHSIAVSHLILDYGDRFEVVYAEEALGARLFESNDSIWQIVGRKTKNSYAWMVPQGKVVSYANELEDISAAYHSGFDSKRIVLLNNEQIRGVQTQQLNAPKPDEFEAKVDLSRRSPEYWELTTQSNQRGWLVFSHSWYPGWTANVDGEAVELIQANGPFFAMPLPKGEHTVDLTFETPGLKLGLWISGITWGICILILLMPSRFTSIARRGDRG